MPQFAELPSVFTKGEFCFVIRSDEDLTIISPEFMAPNNVQQEAGYRCIRTVPDPQANAVGVIDALVQPLTSSNISIYLFSASSSTYIFLMEESLVPATQALQKAGHEFVHED